MNYDRPELRDRLASEYVLGTLHGPARRRFQRLMQGDARMRIAVERWEQRLMPMGGALEAPVPSPKVWEAIAARVAPAQRPAAQPGWFERWFGVRALGGMAAGLMMGVGAMLVVPQLDRAPQSEQQLPESYAGFLQDAQGRPTMLVSSLRHGKVVDIKLLQPVAVQPDQVLQLWGLPKDGAPLPLGVVPAQGKGRITINGTSEQWLSKVTELAVSVETRGRAPVPAPTTPFILRGPCAKFW
jgi:anti-sigma-K factor RskA